MKVKYFVITYQKPGTAPTDPNVPEMPSIKLASHSTQPPSVRFEPRPEFVIGSSYRKIAKFTNYIKYIY